MDTANFQSVKKSFVKLPDAEQLRLVCASLWRLTRANASAINTQRFYNLKRVIEQSVCINADVRDDQPKTIPFGNYKNIFLTQEQYNQLVAENGQDVVTDAVEQLSYKLNSGEYQTADYLRSCRDFIKTEKMFRAKHEPKEKKSNFHEFIKHNYSPEIFKPKDIDEIEF